MSKPYSWRSRLGIRLAIATAAAGVASLCVTLSASAFVLNVLPTTLPDTTKGSAYSQTLTLSSGYIGPVVWEASSGLPPGITLSLSGVLSGGCSSPGTYTFTANAIDNGFFPGYHASRVYTIVVNPPVNIDGSYPAGTVGTYYDQTIGVSGGTAPYTITMTGPEGGGGALPTGLHWASGRVYGTPAAGTAGTYYITVNVQDSVGYMSTVVAGLTINASTPPPATLVITPTTLPAAVTRGVFYSTSLNTTGGTWPYAYSQTGGTLPVGLSLSSGGILSGTPTTATTYAFTVKVTDSASPQNSQMISYTMIVNPPGTVTLGISPASLASGVAGSYYVQTFTASGATGAVTWTPSGSLPPGMSLSSGGVLSGTPTTANTYTFGVTATDSVGATGSASYSLSISGTPATLAVATTYLSNPVKDYSYSATLNASGGLAPYTWILQAGTLPYGLSFSTAGVISGIPTTVGTYTFSVRVTDARSNVAYQTYSVTVASSGSTLLDNLARIGLSVHSLVKLPDDNNPYTQEDTAVYYIGIDGKRHAFPNDKVYFTWFSDFGGIRVISGTDMASIPLGSNVTYKPGKKMVKFTTDPKVYAVDRGGVLRWVKGESLAIALYGPYWNRMIDDISDAFYVNYVFGADVNSTADYNTSVAGSSVTWISDSLRM